jgi:hypothetical protein
MRMRIAPTVLSVMLSGAAVAAPTTVRVSVASDGAEPDGPSYPEAITPDGRFIVYLSYATNLVADDTNNLRDIFIHDQVTGSVERVNVASDGKQANGESYSGRVNADGRFVVFESRASNLVDGDTNASVDVFVRDRKLGLTERVSVDPVSGASGGYLPDVSGDGRYVVFSSSAITGGAQQVYRYDRHLSLLEMVSVSANGDQANGLSWYPSVTESGDLIVFSSYASNLVAGDTNAREDVFLRSMSAGTTTRLSVNGFTQGNGRSHSPRINATGEVVVFTSYATNLSPIDTNPHPDVYKADVATGDLSVVSASGPTISNGWSINPHVDYSGVYVTFISTATNFQKDMNDLQDVYVSPSVSTSSASPEIVSLTWNGRQLSRPSGGEGAVSYGAEYMLFGSDDPNVVVDDTNGVSDVFVRGPNH